jgi:hypothetical protein
MFQIDSEEQKEFNSTTGLRMYGDDFGIAVALRQPDCAGS